GVSKALYVMGSNPARSTPATARVAAALGKLELLVVQGIFPTDTAKLAHVVLPATSFAEKEGTYTNTERRIQRINPALAPIGESRPDWQILIDVAQRTAKDKAWVERQFHFHAPSDVMGEISRVAGIYGGVPYERPAD